MSKIKVLVVEDEIIIADNVCHTLDTLGFEVLEPVMSYTEAISSIEHQKPDIAILDIQLAGKKTGIDLAEKMNKDYKFPFIFLTSYSDKATLEEAKKVMPPAYLVKPFSKEELYTTLEIVLNNFLLKDKQPKRDDQIKESFLFFKDKGAVIKLAFNDILYLKSSHVYVEIVLKNKKQHVIRGSLHEIRGKLNESFVQVHRSYIVNIDYLQKIDTSTLLIHDSMIPISKKYKGLIFAKLQVITNSNKQ